MSPRRALALSSLAVVAVAALAGACAKTPNVSFTVQVPQSVSANVAWVEVGVFAAGKCPSTGELAGGVPQGSLVRLAFKPGDATPSLGNLKKGSYAFAAAARAADCSVLAAGCSTVDVTSTRDVTIGTSAFDTPAAACSGGAVCDDARCVPGAGNNNSNLGAGCSLAFVGAGPLGDPISLSGGAVLSAPAITSTSNGFLIAYREYQSDIGQARLSTLAIDNGGGAAALQTTTLPGQCSMADETDGAAVSWNGSSGLVALARPTCGGSGGVDTFAVDATGTVTQSGYNPGSGNTVALSSAKALAPTTGGGLLAFTVAGEARVVSVNGLLVQNDPVSFGGGTPLSSARVATSERVTALLATGQTGAPAPGPDAGGDAGDDGGAPEAGGGPPPGATVRLNMVPTGSPLGSLGAPISMLGSWGSLTALGARVFVVTNANGNAVVWQAFDLGAKTPAATDLLALQGNGAPLFADVAASGDHAFFAIMQQGAVSLVAYANASKTPVFARQIYFPNDKRIPQQPNVSSGGIAVAASDSRVAVVWTTAQALTTNDAVGGYAVFACTP